MWDSIQWRRYCPDGAIAGMALLVKQPPRSTAIVKRQVGAGGFKFGWRQCGEDGNNRQRSGELCAVVRKGTTPLGAKPTCWFARVGTARVPRTVVGSRRWPLYRPGPIVLNVED